MSGDPDDLLDNTPEAVAMRRARAAREKAAADRAAAVPDRAAARQSGRRKLLIGAGLGALMAARVFERAVRGGR